MKAKKLACALTGAVLAVGMALSLTACSGNGKSLGKAKLNLDDYAIDYNKEASDLGIVNGSYSELKQLNFDGECRFKDKYCVVMNSTGSAYSVYNVEAERFIAGNLASDPYNSLYVDKGDTLYADGTAYNLEYIRFEQYSQSLATTKYYYAPDGVLLFKADDGTAYFSLKLAYIAGSNEACPVLMVTGNSNGNYATKYFKCSVSKAVASYNYLENFVEISEDEISTYAPEYGAGNVLNVLAKPIYEEDEDGNRVEGEMADYSYARLGNTYAFYKDGKKTGSADVRNIGKHAFVDNYMYFTRLEKVDYFAQDGYNYADSQGYKYNYSLNRYDILKDKTQTLDFNVVIEEFYPQYNYNLKKYDALIISGYEKVGGVARWNNAPFSYAVNKELKIGYDLKELYGTMFQGIAKLSDSRYLVVMGSEQSPAMYVTDEKLGVINRITGLPLPNLGTVMFNVNGLYGFADLDGNILCAPEYDSVGGFYGGISSATARLASGETRNVLIDSQGKILTDLSAMEEDTDARKVTVQVYDGFYRVNTTVYGANASVNAEFYGYDGMLLGSFGYAGLSTTSVEAVANVIEAGDCYIVEELVISGSGVINYSYKYHKVA